jgi:YVTN family beta-propeller protein
MCTVILIYYSIIINKLRLRMKEIKFSKTRGRNPLIKPLGITVLALLMLVGITGAAPYAYITNNGYKENVTVIDTATDTVIDTVYIESGSLGVAVNPQGTKVYVASTKVYVIDTSTNTVTDTVNVGMPVWGIAVNPAGTAVYVTGSDSGTVSVINTSTNTVTATVNVGSYPVGVAVTPDGKNIYVANQNDTTVSVIDAANNTVTNTVNVGNHPLGVAFNPAGTTAYVTNSDSSSVSAIDTSTNTVVANVSVGSYPYGVAVNPEGTKVYVANYNDSNVSVIDTATNTVVSTVPVSLHPHGIAVTPNGKKVFVANEDGNISVIDTATNTVTATATAGYNPIALGQFIGPELEISALVANFTSNVTSGNVPLSVQFTDLSENATEWYWDFGDGNNSDQQNPTHTYSATGTYAVTLTVSNAEGSDEITKTDYIKVGAASSVKLTSVTLDPENSTGATTNAPGAWTTNLADPLTQICVRDENGVLLNQPFSGGLFGEISIPLEPGINNLTLIGDGIFPDNMYYGAVLYFDSIQTPPQIAVYNSNGGTGDFSVQPADTDIIGSANGGLFMDKAPGTSVYTAPDGTKVEVLSFVIDSNNETIDEVSSGDMGSNGNPDTIARLSLKVTPSSAPVAVFSAFPTSGGAPLTVVFTDNSTGSPTSWHWDFGDGSDSTEQNPTHTYIEEGIYTVNLTVSNATGTGSKLATIDVSSGSVESAVLSFNPQTIKVLPGYSQDVQIMIDEVPAGLSGFNITISVSDPEIAEITAVSFPSWGQLPKNSTLPSSSIWIKTIDLENEVHPGDTNVSLGTITLTGKMEGTSDISIQKTMISDDNGSLINPAVNTGKINVVILPAFPGYANLPSDLNQDDLYEDINGNGMLDFNDVVAFYNNMDWIEENALLEFFDYNKNGLIDFDDVVELYDLL